MKDNYNISIQNEDINNLNNNIDNKNEEINKMII